MSRDDPVRTAPFPAALQRPQISLLGKFDQAMAAKLCCELREPDGQGDIAIEVTTEGGDPELARRMLLEVRDARRRLGRRILFIGKTAVYSAGMTFMAGFPRADRFLTRDTVVLLHVRQLNQTVEISGPMRASLPQVQALCRQFEMGMKLEEENFRELIEGSKLELEALLEKALYDWYLSAEEAEELGLIAGIVD